MKSLEVAFTEGTSTQTAKLAVLYLSSSLAEMGQNDERTIARTHSQSARNRHA
jgi:hypothetical protein